VDDGVVTLTGKVGNAYQKERAASDVRWIQNVKDVDNKLKLEWWEDDGVRNNPPTLSDSELEKSVRDELYQDLTIVDPYEITVEALSGHITLQGTVPTYNEKMLAAKDARDVIGVTWVSNLLKVQGQPRDDEAIRNDIKFELGLDETLGGENINPTVVDGVVTLSGDVNTYYEKIHAEEVASKVKGVEDIVDELHVNWSPKFSDQELQKQIQDRISSNWETHWIADQINVSVSDGYVILSGDVNLWSERQEAARLAYLTDGIRGVENRLTVKGVEYPWNEMNHDNSRVVF
jgi:osmotically-inducible protein OsmY